MPIITIVIIVVDVLVIVFVDVIIVVDVLVVINIISSSQTKVTFCVLVYPVCIEVWVRYRGFLWVSLLSHKLRYNRDCSGCGYGL